MISVTQTSFLLVQDLVFLSFIIVLILFVFSSFNGLSERTLLVKTIWKRFARVGSTSVVITILLSYSLEHKYLFCLDADDIFTASY